MAKGITEQVIRSSGNVFADMGLPDAAELDTKARLGAALNLIVERQRLSQAEIATALQTIDRKLSVHERKRITLQELFTTMLHQLMTGEINVVDLDIDVSEIQS